MKKGWAKVPLGELLDIEIDAVPVDPAETYPFAGVYGFGRGLFVRDSLKGSDTTYSHFHRLHEDLLVMSQPKGWEGAITVVPKEFEGRFLSSVFPTFRPREYKLSPAFLRLVTKCKWLWDALFEKSNGIGARRNSIYPAQLLEVSIPLPPLAEQQRIVAHLDAIESRLTRAQNLREEQEKELKATLSSAFHKLEAEADWVEMSKVAPLVRREVTIDPEGSYPELGIRSFGRGTFHKPPVLGMETTKRLFEIHAGDLVFSNVFAWEGAIAVAQPEDHGRLGSHRFISCVCDSDRVLADYLQFYFLTPDGLEKIGKASPGGAGRNRTLGIEKLSAIKVPIVPLATQLEFEKLLDLQSRVRTEAAQSSQRTTALLPSLLDRLFNS
jgi:type I restriction enzyme, S subunit